MKKIMTLALMIAFNAFTGNTNAQETSKTDEFKPSGKFSGQVFGDFEVKTHSDSLLRGSTQYAKSPYVTTFNSFEFRRIYLGYDYNFTEQFTAQLLLSHEGNNFDAQGDRTFLLNGH